MKSIIMGMAAVVAGFALSVGGVANAQQKKAEAAANPQANLDKGMQMAPAIITAAKVSCTPTAANFLFTGEANVGDKKVPADFVEVACENSLGYVLASHKDGSGASAYDCLATNTTGADGKPHPLKCALPANADPARGLVPAVTKAGFTCDVEGGRAVGMTASATYYELNCKNADGLFVGLENPRSDGKVQVNTCYQRSTTNAPCTLTTKEESAASVMALASKGDKPCAPSQHRYVARSNAGNLYYEFACPDGSGFITEAKPNGEFSRSIPCAMATGIAGGCTLSQFTPATTNARTEDNATYTQLAKKAGFDCEVTKYGAFPRREGEAATLEVLELACANRPDGGVAYFGGAKDEVVPCILGRAQGFRCSYTQESLAYPKLTAALRAKGRETCTVNDARPVGASPEEDFIEVGCSDGLPGWVIVYKHRSNALVDVLNCGQAAEIAGGCQLANNKRNR